MTSAVKIQGLVKRYGSMVALNSLSFEIPEGKLIGFLGPNGAGKTTTFRCMLGLTHPQEGEIEIMGMKVGPQTHKIVKRVGAIIEEPGLHKTLSGVNNMRVSADVLGHGGDDIPGLLEFVELSGVANRKVGEYSKGMRQRLALACALLGDPEMLILDEPLDGLDPAGQVAFKNRLRGLVSDQGKTVIVSSHDLADVEEIADEVIVINKGSFVASGSVDEIVGDQGILELEVDDLSGALKALRGVGMDAEGVGGRIQIKGAEATEVSRTLAASNIYPKMLRPLRNTLEEVFLSITESEA